MISSPDIPLRSIFKSITTIALGGAAALAWMAQPQEGPLLGQGGAPLWMALGLITFCLVMLGAGARQLEWIRERAQDGDESAPEDHRQASIAVSACGLAIPSAICAAGGWSTPALALAAIANIACAIKIISSRPRKDR